MDILNALVIIPLSAGPVFIAAGIILYLRPPKKINQIYGYRTKRSMASQEAWDYAQTASGKQLVYLGLAFLSTSLLGKLFPTMNELWGTFISLGLMIVGTITLFRIMERSLKQKFG